MHKPPLQSSRYESKCVTAVADGTKKYNLSDLNI